MSICIVYDSMSEVNKAYLTKIIRIGHGYVLYATKFKHFWSQSTVKLLKPAQNNYN